MKLSIHSPLKCLVLASALISLVSGCATDADLAAPAIDADPTLPVATAPESIEAGNPYWDGVQGQAGPETPGALTLEEDRLVDGVEPAPADIITLDQEPAPIPCSAQECDDVCGVHFHGESCQACLCEVGCAAVIGECGGPDALERF